MCLIIDNNRLGDFFREPIGKNKDSQPIHNWLENKQGNLVVGKGDKFSEIPEKFNNEARGIKGGKRLNSYYSRGIIRSIPFEKWKPELKNLENKKLASDDPHILALAIASKTKLLYTADKNLMNDFKKIIKQGKVYSNQKNKDLLTRDTCP